jgi:hypothetical protein
MSVSHELEMTGMHGPLCVRCWTATGKIQTFKLREPYWKDQERQVG